jgi:Family of unknown function (DUF6526)
MTEQTYANHIRLYPPFHFFVLPVMLMNCIWSMYRYKVLGFSFAWVAGVLVAFALLLGFLSARIFVLTVQDRLIRLEERLRLQSLLPSDLQPRIGELNVGQLVSLRFAGDDEVVGLTRKVLDEKIKDRKSIKQLVKHWKADYLRA